MDKKLQPWPLLTMVDLKVVDPQAFEDGHALLQDVQGLAQLRVCCAVHPADLRGMTLSLKPGWAARTDGERDRCRTWMWSLRRRACSFLYSLVELLPL